jgi:hypothetical protein
VHPRVLAASTTAAAAVGAAATFRTASAAASAAAAAVPADGDPRGGGGARVDHGGLRADHPAEEAADAESGALHVGASRAKRAPQDRQLSVRIEESLPLLLPALAPCLVRGALLSAVR